MNKQDVALDNLQWSIRYKTKLNQTKPYFSSNAFLY